MNHSFFHFLLRIDLAFWVATPSLLVLICSRWRASLFLIFIGLLYLFFFFLLFWGLLLLISILKNGAKTKRFSFLLVYRMGLLFCSILMALLSGLRLEKSAPFYPVCCESITSIEVECLRDSMECGCNSRIEGKLLNAGFKNGEGVAGGWVVIFCLKNINQLTFFSGDRVRIEGVQLGADGALATVINGRSVQLVNRPASFFRSLRVGSRNLLKSWALESGDPGGLILALFDGDRALVEEGVKRAYRKAGVSHLLALSGMHLGVIAALVMMMVRPLTGGRGSFVVAAIFAIVFGWFAGGSPSLFRAVLMMVMALFFRLKGGGVPTKLILAFAFVVSLFLQPYSASSAAFILSYLALTGLLLFQPAITVLLRQILPLKLSLTLSAIFSAQFLTSFWLLPQFGEFSSAGIFSSIILTPLTFALMAVGLFSLSFAFISIVTIKSLILIPLRTLYSLNQYVLVFFAQFPMIGTLLGLFLYFLPLMLLLLLFIMLNCRQRRMKKK